MLIDTHAHIHSKDYPLDANEVLQNAQVAGVQKMIVVGCDTEDSRLAVDFAAQYEGVWAAVGIHPHEATRLEGNDLERALQGLKALVAQPKVVAIGECGLDFYYNDLQGLVAQERLLRFQIELALEHNLPLIFHVRNAFEQFWPIFDDYRGIRGVVHSFSSGQSDINHIYSKRLLIGLNGIMTFSRDQAQLDAAKSCPTDQIVLETDSPYLTPSPKRGKVNEPANVRLVSNFLSELRDEDPKAFDRATTANAEKLFGI